MRIQVTAPGTAIHVSAAGDAIELRLGEPADPGGSVATLSVPQAEMVLHALGFEIAQIRERQRLAAEERQHLARVIEDTEIRRR